MKTHQLYEALASYFCSSQFTVHCKILMRTSENGLSIAHICLITCGYADPLVGEPPHIQNFSW